MKAFLMGSLLLAFACSEASVRAEERIDREEVSASIERSLPYLEREAFAWLEGTTPPQKAKNNGCVSCHQVPAGAWSLAIADRALKRSEENTKLNELLERSVSFLEENDAGQPASWSQLLLASALVAPERANTHRELFRQKILDGQQESGAWLGAGQFPTQRRPLPESDAVVSMWMILSSTEDANADMQAALDKAQTYSASVNGSTTEWLAMQVLVERDVARKSELGRRLVGEQREDGSWGWRSGEEGNAYTTGVALFALSQVDGVAQDALERSVAYLVQHQAEDGTWKIDSKWFTKKPNPKAEYVYQYWATAWATIGLSQYLMRG